MAIVEFSGEYEFLSNFYPATVKIAGVTFPSNEHAFQGLKSDRIDVVRQFSDPKMTPGEAKKLGQKIQLRKDWDKVKVGLMYTINREKFSNHENLKRLLLATEHTELVECNSWGDKVWGVSLSDGEGENLLGKILMTIRGELRHLEDLKTKKKEEKENTPKEDVPLKPKKTYAAKEFILPLLEGE